MTLCPKACSLVRQSSDHLARCPCPLAVQMLVFYTWTVRNLADTISLMASTEKVGWLATKTPQEGDALYNADSDSSDSSAKDIKDVESNNAVIKVDARGDGGAPAGWPRRGTIEFDNVWMRYLPTAPYALKGGLSVAGGACFARLA